MASATPVEEAPSVSQRIVEVLRLIEKSEDGRAAIDAQLKAQDAPAPSLACRQP